MIMAAKEISDEYIEAALRTDKDYLYDPRRVEFHINAARTGGTFYDVVYKGKKRQRTKLAKWPAITAKALFSELAAIRANALADREAQLTLPVYETGDEVLFWFMQHIDQSNAFSEVYVSTASSYIANHLLGILDNIRLNDIDMVFLYKQLYIPMQSRYALSTIKGVFGVLKSAFTHAYELGLIARNPMKKIMFGCFVDKAAEQIDTKRDRQQGRLTPEDLPKLFALINKQGLQKRLFFLLQIHHGTGITATRLAEWQQVSREKGEWYLPESHCKNGQERRLVLSQQMIDLLDCFSKSTRYKQSDYLFSARGNKPVTKRTVERWYQNLSDEVGIKFTGCDLGKLDFGVDLYDAK
ncbi:tyrosine-type recombinase/integrase [Marinomonas transparens]|uniref:Tyrosine-type recombinase/integrase n=1 Tax=Marinomonas transparens TaxID=2795388 RepID=A0A934JSN3_9GAMM|nr:tyrosine-type recombinase/integrase [Marinomonas transparens]MBJ7536645.1 tyrosine-type recombinase/integrase [Marinomonas transparens]